VRRVGAQVGIDSDGAVVTGAELDRMDDAALTRKLREVSLFARTDPRRSCASSASSDSRRGGRVTGDGVNDAPPSRRRISRGYGRDRHGRRP